MSAPRMCIGVRDLIRLEASMCAVRHHETVNHKPTASKPRYDPVIKNLKIEFDTLKDRKKKDVLSPQIS